MLVHESALFAHPRDGRITLQIPMVEVYHTDEEMAADQANPTATFEIPDEWVCELKAQTPCVGSQSGFTYWTRAGWEANKSRIRKEFESSNSQRGSWKMFEKVAEDHFAEVERKRAKLVKRLTAQLKQARAFKT